MKACDPAPNLNRRSDQPHPALSADGRKDFDIERKAGSLLNRMGAKPLHFRSGVFAIESDAVLASDRRAALKTKNVINSARPGEGVIALEVAFPAAGMMGSEFPNAQRGNRVRDRAIQQRAMLEVAGLFPKGPIAIERGPSLDKHLGMGPEAFCEPALESTACARSKLEENPPTVVGIGASDNVILVFERLEPPKCCR